MCAWPLAAAERIESGLEGLDQEFVMDAATVAGARRCALPKARLHPKSVSWGVRIYDCIAPAGAVCGALPAGAPSSVKTGGYRLVPRPLLRPPRR